MMASSARLMVAALLFCVVTVLSLFSLPTGLARPECDQQIRLPSEKDVVGTRWALLVAGSSGFGNYRHQADVCHAYQILRNGGLKDENIVVFMYDDIAYNPQNPRPGVIINNPNGEDVYKGVPKDYTGKEVTANNLFAVLLGNRNAVTGGSKKVINSTKDDHIFVYYSDHGGPGVLGMPNLPNVFAADFIKVLKKKHALQSYKKMVLYVESCESGSIFEGLLPENLDIYVMTASNATESSWGTYCPGGNPPPPPKYKTCLGDLYSVSWMEDSDSHDRQVETLAVQYDRVKKRTTSSHVMEYGDKSFKNEPLCIYQGFAPSNANVTENRLCHGIEGGVNQRDADLLFLWKRYEWSSAKGEKSKILEEIREITEHRKHLDNAVDFIGKIIFGLENGPSTLSAVRPGTQPLVDDWACLKRMVRAFESTCGSLTQYGMKHMRSFANICNNGVSVEEMEEASVAACSNYNAAGWSPLEHGYSA